MAEYRIMIPDGTEEEELDDELMAYNLRQVPPSQEEPFIKICRCAKDDGGRLLGGVLACSILWKVLSVETVWVREEYRGMGIARKLLFEVEKEAVRRGCSMAQLDTFDFQARGFYEKCGYQVFGILPDMPKGHTRYYMYKLLGEKNNP